MGPYLHAVGRRSWRRERGALLGPMGPCIKEAGLCVCSLVTLVVLCVCVPPSKICVHAPFLFAGHVAVDLPAGLT